MAIMRWAPTTLSSKASVWGQFIDFVRINVISPNEQAMIAFLQAKLEAKEINVQTYIKYAAELSQIVKQGPQPLLRDVVAGLRTAAAASQEVHAIPFAPEDLVKIIHTPFLPAHVRTALYLCFKTGSRWDEIAHLTRESVTILNSHELFINFRAGTKASQRDPYRPDMRVLVADEQGFPQFVRDCLQQLLDQRSCRRGARHR